jgi:hypothetical protein
MAMPAGPKNAPPTAPPTSPPATARPAASELGGGGCTRTSVGFPQTPQKYDSGGPPGSVFRDPHVVQTSHVLVGGGRGGGVAFTHGIIADALLTGYGNATS